MKILFSFIILIASTSNLVLAQDNKLSVKLEIIPSLKDIFKGQEFTLLLFSDSLEERVVIKSDTVTFAVPLFDSLILDVQCHVDIKSFSKSYFATYKIEKNKSSKITSVKFKFPVDCQYNLQGIDRKCPKCHKPDKVIPICYGLPMYDENGNKIGPKCYSAGCMVSECDPSWYCERDKYKF